MITREIIKSFRLLV